MGHAVQYGYDAANNVTSFTDSANRQTGYSYDAGNRLQTATASGRTINYTWKPDGLLDQVTYGNGMSRVYGYDNADRLKTVTNSFGAGSSEHLAYDYDPNSNRTAETRKLNGQTIRTIAYGFDDLDRLTQAGYTSANVGRGLKAEYYNNRDFTDLQLTRLDPTINFSWPGTATPDSKIADIKLEYAEATGDAEIKLSWSSTSQAKQVVPQSALFVADTDLNYEYDLVGNRTRENGTDLARRSIDRSYDYDSNNRLNGINGTIGDPLGSVSLQYDANGNVKSVIQSSRTTNYDYDVGNQLRRITNSASGQLVNRYDYGADLIRGEIGSEGERFYFSDALGSITGLAQGTGGLATRNEYDAWGEKIVAGASLNRISYTGQYRDEETGLMALGNGERYYSPSFGRFIQEDSFAGILGVPESLNRHSYVHGNPTKYTDPSGHIIPLLIWGAIAIVCLVDEEEKNRLLEKYWSIPDRQVETSVVLVDGKYEQSRDL